MHRIMSIANLSHIVLSFGSSLVLFSITLAHFYALGRPFLSPHLHWFSLVIFGAFFGMFLGWAEPSDKNRLIVSQLVLMGLLVILNVLCSVSLPDVLRNLF